MVGAEQQRSGAAEGDQGDACHTREDQAAAQAAADVHRPAPTAAESRSAQSNESRYQQHLAIGLARWYGWRVAHRDRRSNLPRGVRLDRKSTRLNSSHMSISYAV